MLNPMQCHIKASSDSRWVRIGGKLGQPSTHHTDDVHVVSGFAATIVVQADSPALTLPHGPQQCAEDMREYDARAGYFGV